MTGEVGMLTTHGVIAICNRCSLLHINAEDVYHSVFME